MSTQTSNIGDRSLENGLDPNGSIYTNIEFLDGSNFLASVWLRSPDLDPTNNPIITLQSSVPISRLDYFIFLDDQGLNIGSNSVRFNFATPVPEPLTILGVATAIAFGTGFKGQLSKAQKK